MFESPEEAVDTAVEGLWTLYAAMCASDRAVSVRPCWLVRGVDGDGGARGLLTSAVRRMLLNLPA